MPKKILYIGNKLSDSGRTATTIDTLSVKLKDLGYHVYSFSGIRNKWFRLLEMLYRTFQYRRKADIVLIDTYSTRNFYFAVGVAKVCRIFNLPYIPILHGGNLPDRLKNNPGLSGRLFNGSKTNISPSKFLFEQFKDHGYHNLTHIPNSIEIKNYPFLLRKEFKPKLLWVRSFADIYNPMLALKIVEQLLEKRIEVVLTMIGPEKDGSLSKCKEYVQQNNLPVTFTGKLSKEEWINLSKGYDIFINTTQFDNMPVSVIEAMALGLPVISTNVGGMPYLIEQNTTGILVPPNDEHAFADEIISLIEHPQKATDLAGNARKAVEQFDWEIVKEKWLIYLSGF